MDLTDTQFDLLFRAWAAAAKRAGLIIKPEELPAAHELAEGGWLARHIHDDVLSWWWTVSAEQALSTGALIAAEQDPGRRN